LANQIAFPNTVVSLAGEAPEVSVSHRWVARYLALLGLDAPRPDLETLRRLNRAHLAAVPFENVTAILRRRAHLGRPVPPPDPEALLAAWEEGRGGALCFEAAAMLERLLPALGFQARVVLADISSPGSHQALLVEVEGQRFLVDAGNGAPFFDPIPLDAPSEVRRAGLSYRFRPGAGPDSWVQDRLIGGTWQPFCRYDLGPADPAQREAAYQRNHTPDGGWIVGTLTLIRCREEEVLVLRDDEFTRISAAGKRSERIPDPADRARLAATAFGLPRLPVAAALRALADLAGEAAWRPAGEGGTG